MNKIVNALVEAQLAHILNLCQNVDVVTAEVDAFVGWLNTVPFNQLISLEQIVETTQKQGLSVPISSGLMSQIVTIIHAVLEHPINDSTFISTLIPQDIVEEIAVYISSQKDHRENLIHEIFNNPIYVDLLSNTISHAISDYMENNALTKSVPGVGSLMKFGKAALERATSTNLDDALESYLGKNIKNIASVSERMANKHLGDKQVHALILETWQKIKQKPLSEVRQYVTVDAVDKGADISGKTWEHLRVHAFIVQQVTDAIGVWYAKNETRTIVDILSDVHVDVAVVNAHVASVAMPVVKKMVASGYVATRVKALLVDFYSSDEVAEIFKLGL